jgi:hypothetical protein
MMPCSRPSCSGPGIGELGFDWGTFISDQVSGWSKAGQNILTSQNQTKGIYTQTGPQGTITYVQPAGTSQNIFGASSTGITGTATTSSGMGIVLIGGAALLLVFMLAKGKGH